MKPLRSTTARTGSILNPSFEYTPAARTNIRETFAREKARLAAQPAQPKHVDWSDPRLDRFALAA